MKRLRETETPKPTRLLPYYRVSTRKQKVLGVGLDVQRERAAAYAAFAKVELVAPEEDVRCGGDPDRPAFERALVRIEAGEADGLLVFSMDRLARSTSKFLEVAERLRAKGRVLVCLREQLDTSTPHGRFAATILAALAEMERELIRERTLDAKEALLAAGRARGPTPFGMRRSAKVDRNGRRDPTLLPDPREAETLKMVRAWRVAGYSLRQIGTELERRRVPAKRGGRAWSAGQVASVLRTAETYEDALEPSPPPSA